MQRLINKYLSNTFYIDTDSENQYNIYFKDSDKLIYWMDLISEISKTFGYDNELSEGYIKNWLDLNYTNCKLDLYYEKVYNPFDIFFPTISRVVSKTIAQDLVSVQPMEQPRCNLMY